VSKEPYLKKQTQFVYGSLKKQSQFAGGQIGVNSLLKGYYKENRALRRQKNKANVEIGNILALNSKFSIRSP
jgi:hypothetical protein